MKLTCHDVADMDGYYGMYDVGTIGLTVTLTVSRCSVAMVSIKLKL